MRPRVRKRGPRGGHDEDNFFDPKHTPQEISFLFLPQGVEALFIAKPYLRWLQGGRLMLGIRIRVWTSPKGSQAYHETITHLTDGMQIESERVRAQGAEMLLDDPMTLKEPTSQVEQGPRRMRMLQMRTHDSLTMLVATRAFRPHDAICLPLACMGMFRDRSH